MNPSALFIRRPVGTILLAIGIFLAGAVAYFKLPVASLPSVDMPAVRVSAALPGADPETVAATIAAPLERHIGEIAGVNELTSTSQLGSISIQVQFDLSRNADDAARDVQAAINAAQADLPSTLTRRPTIRKSNAAAAPIMILAMTSACAAAHRSLRSWRPYRLHADQPGQRHRGGADSAARRRLPCASSPTRRT